MSLPRLSLLMLAACGPKDAEGPWDLGAVIPKEPSESGDPEVGRHQLLHGDYMTCGMPYKLWETGGDAIAGALGGSADAPRIPDREGANAALPYNLNVFTTPDGVEVINTNCLGCHGGMADGELVIGLGNATADFTGEGSSLASSIPDALLDAFGLSEAEKAQFHQLAGRAAAISDYAVMRTIGNNPAEQLAVVLMVHHDRETLAWSDEPLTELVIVDAEGQPIADPVVTSDPPPWWRAKKKHALFYNGMARGDGRGTMALATSVCVDTVERAREVDQQFKDIHAYVLSLVAPRYPHAIDRDLAEDGREIYEETCAGCHGTYADDPEDDASDTYPNLILPLDVVGTDPVVANAGVVHAPQLVEWYNGSFYGEITRMEPNDPFPGYMPPPLDGIWATAPFLHNGSVPSLELLLDSRLRPARWKRVDYDSTNFDEQAVGWPWEEVSTPWEELPEEERRHVYDTSYWSQSNAGHTFGDALTGEERTALIEYLKTL
jgi:mono/diheme cytochrome c family protein